MQSENAAAGQPSMRAPGLGSGKVRRLSGRELTQAPNEVGDRLSTFLRQKKKEDELEVARE